MQNTGPGQFTESRDLSLIRKQARIAGMLYILVAVTGPLSLVYIPGKLFVPGAVVTIADNIRASTTLLRMGIASELFYQAVEVFLVLVLYGLFKDVNRNLARQMAVLGFIPIPIVFVNILNEVAALMFAGDAKFLLSMGRPQLDTLATSFAFLHSQGLEVAAIFWGLWLFPLGLLIIRCGFIPRFLGVLVMIAGVGYLLGSFSSLVLPQYHGLLGSAAVILEVGELPIILWLLIWGARADTKNNN